LARHLRAPDDPVHSRQVSPDYHAADGSKS